MAVTLQTRRAWRHRPDSRLQPGAQEALIGQRQGAAHDGAGLDPQVAETVVEELDKDLIKLDRRELTQRLGSLRPPLRPG